MKSSPIQAAVALLAIVAAAAPLLAEAQQHPFEYRLLYPGLKVTAPSSGGGPGSGLLQSTSLVDFGNVATNTTETRQVLVSNTGSGGLTFTAAPSVTGDAAFGAGLTTCGTSLIAGADCLTDVTFSPTLVGEVDGLLTFSSSLANSPHRVALKGTAYNPVSLASTAALELPVGSSFNFSFKSLLTVSNENTPDKNLASWTFSGGIPAGLTFDSATGTLNGTSQGSAAASQAFSVTATYKGNAATQEYTARFYDPYWNKVHTLLKLDDSWLDAKTSSPWTAYGGVQLDSSGAKFGAGSANFDGAGRALVGPSFKPVGSFTIEGWFYPTAWTGWTLINLGGVSGLNWQPQSVHFGWPASGQLNWLASSTNNGTNISNSNGCTMPCIGYTAFGAPTMNAWNHFAVVRDAPAGKYYLYLNGQRKATINSTLTPHTSTSYGVTLGNYPASAATNFPNPGFAGRLDEFRLTDGVARYTQDTYALPVFDSPAR